MTSCLDNFKCVEDVEEPYRLLNLIPSSQIIVLYCHFDPHSLVMRHSKMSPAPPVLDNLNCVGNIDGSFRLICHILSSHVVFYDDHCGSSP